MSPKLQDSTRNFLIAAMTAAFALSACGIKGNLKTPPPLWGEEKPNAPTTSADKTSDASADDTDG